MRLLSKTTLAVFVFGLGYTSAAQLTPNPTNQTNAGQPVYPTDILIFAKNTDPSTLGKLLKPLTVPAQLTGLQLNVEIYGSLVAVNTNNSNSINLDHAIALLSCDPSQFPGYLDFSTTFETIFYRNPYAIILYPNSSFSECSLPIANNSAYATGMLYTTTSPADMISLVSTAESQSGVGFVIAQRSTADTASSNSTQSSSGSGNGFTGSNSPSTAVAMIILYSITGVITALFLIIIITGAVRAHRNPERYGPRAGLGRRPGQSRARGLARAMLDTIPIVKWGEREDKDEEDATTRDIEMAGGVADVKDDEEDSEAGSGGHASDGNAAEASGTREGEATDAIVAEGAKNTSEEPKIANSEGVYASPEQPAPTDENLGCSICTEDFEKGQDVRVLPCHHAFHPACIDPWLLNVSSTCPLCRVDLRPADPTDPRSSSISSADGELPPPIEALRDPSPSNARRSSRRGSRMWDIREVLNPRTMRNASAQERIEALRVVREQGVDDDARVRRRLTARLQDVFSVKTFRRGRSPTDQSEDAGVRASVASASGMSRGVRDSIIEESEDVREHQSATVAPESVPEHSETPIEASAPVTESETLAKPTEEAKPAVEEAESSEPGPSNTSVEPKSSAKDS